MQHQQFYLKKLNSLSTSLFLFTIYTNFNSFNLSKISKLNGAITCSRTLNIVGNITAPGLSVLSIFSNLYTFSKYSYFNISVTSNNLNSQSSFSYIKYK